MTDDTPNGKEIRIPIKEATAKNFLVLNASLEQARQEVALRERRVQDSLRPFFTEHELPMGSRVIEVTQQPPYELVVQISEGSPN